MSDLKGVKCQVGLLNGQNENRDLAKYFLLIMLVATNFNQNAAQSQFELSLAQLSPSLFLIKFGILNMFYCYLIIFL